MKCSNCNKEYEDWRAECPHCKNQNKGKNNANCLNILANINLILFIIASLYCLYNAFMGIIGDDYVKEISIGVNLVSGISLLLVGFTIFFLLKTIVDIYFKVDKKYDK